MVSEDFSAGPASTSDEETLNQPDRWANPIAAMSKIPATTHSENDMSCRNHHRFGLLFGSEDVDATVFEFIIDYPHNETGKKTGWLV